MKAFFQSISSLSAVTEGSDICIISDVLDFYKKVPRAYTSLAFLRRELKKKYPWLFQKQPQYGAEELRLECVQTDADPSPGALKNVTEKEMVSFTKARNGKILRFKKEIQTLFSAESHKHTFRVKKYESFLEASKKYRDRRSIMDIVGMRVVPKEAAFFPEMIQHMEASFRGRIGFRLNTFAYTDREMKEMLGKYSAYHRAIHYYFSLGDFYMEIQMKTPAIDQWSVLHHDTMYKPKVPISVQEKRAIMRFGRIANIVDYYRMLQA